MQAGSSTQQHGDCEDEKSVYDGVVNKCDWLECRLGIGIYNYKASTSDTTVNC